MSYKEPSNTSSGAITLPTGLPTYSKISELIKKIVNASQYDYHESEAFVVEDVILNDPIYHGGVRGYFINNRNQNIKGGESIVRPLFPHISNIPVKGEHVVVTEYNGQHYYTSIINRKNSPNENSIPIGLAEGTRYGKTFKRKDIRRVEVCEGDIVYEGRFGNSIKLGCNHTNNSPVIKIRAGQQTPPREKNVLVKESIDNDASSIYLTSDGLSGETFEGEQVTGKKILIKSDGIFINGRQDIKLNSDKVLIGNNANQSVVRGDDLKKFINDLLTDLDMAFSTAMATITPAGVVVSGGALAPAPYKAVIQGIRVKLNQSPMLSKNVKTV